jgi:hypothetical protein
LSRWSKSGEGFAGRYETQAAVNGGHVVDRRMIGGLFGEEHALVRSHGSGEWAVGKGGGGEAGFIQFDKIVPVACEAFAAQAVSQEDGLCRSRRRSGARRFRRPIAAGAAVQRSTSAVPRCGSSATGRPSR